MPIGSAVTFNGKLALIKTLIGGIPINIIMTIEVSRDSYGFGHTWTLKAFGKSFYLGQDTKFCYRILRMEPRAVVNEIGSGDMSLEKTRKNLAKFIVDHLGINRSNVKTLNAWDICAE